MRPENSTSIRSVAPVLFLATLIFTSVGSIAQSIKQSYLLALSKGDHTLAIVNSSTLKVIAKIPVGPDPHEVVASSDGKTAYVTNTGGGKSYEINVIDLVAQKSVTKHRHKTFDRSARNYFCRWKGLVLSRRLEVCWPFRSSHQ